MTLELHSSAGEELQFELSGVYGGRLDATIPGVPEWFRTDVSLLSEPWKLDGLHGSEPDRHLGIVHHGARHALLDDGRWMQPEPLLESGKMFEPRGMNGVYAGGNPLGMEDTDGRTFSPLDAGLLLLDLHETGAAAADYVGAGVTLLKEPSLENFGKGFIKGAVLGAAGAGLVAGAVLPGGGLSKAAREIGEGATDAVGAVARRGENIVGGACFVAGTEVVTPDGPAAIETVQRGTLVVASTKVLDAQWQEIGACIHPVRPPSFCDHAKRWAAAAVLPAAVVTACDLGHPGVEAVNAVQTSSVADIAWDPQGVPDIPYPYDEVLVLQEGEAATYALLRDVTPGERFAFGGRVFDTADADGDLELEIRWSGDVLARVTDTFVRPVAEVIDAEIEHEDGSVEVVTGTPNHPFWVPAVRDYVPLGKLEIGTVLHVQGGGEAILVSKTWRQGEFEVFDFEVEGLHNFYVRGEGSDAAGVLVHNSTPKRIEISRSKYPESAAHIDEAQAAGHPSVLTVDRGGAKARRRESLKGHETTPGNDRDEYPPAMFKEGGKGSSVKPVRSGDNRGSGSCMGHQCRDVADNEQVEMVTVD